MLFAFRLRQFACSQRIGLHRVHTTSVNMAAVEATLNALKAADSSAAQNSGGQLELKNTQKRDDLIHDEKKFQKLWQDRRIFEVDAPSVSEFPPGSITAGELRERIRKFFGTMAYPYMNGTLHAGHSFTVSKIEFAAGYARMQGKKVLYPQGYHCTGMPIKACADKLVREIEMFGPTFENCPESAVTNGDTTHSLDDDLPAPTQDQSKEDITKFSAKKSKAAAKTVNVKYQFQIMLSLGIPLQDIQKFADPQHWLHYFPPLCKRDLTNFGCRIDWRRSFVTTDANPFYDSFVRWQMNRLHEMGKIKFGKRYTVYSPKDGQACMDHDRSEGEGVGVQEYTALKLKVLEWPDAIKSTIDKALPKGANAYFVPATLRPETMYGQTNCFVGPNLEYGIFKANENEFYICSDRAARNMAFQSIFQKWAEFPKVADLKGSQVVGALVQAPLSIHTRGIRILPMESVKATKGTGIVTSVPSDSPDDYATVMDLAKKAEYYGIKKEWAQLEMPPIIETPSYGNLTAKHLVETLKINSPKDAKQLAEAKDLAYKEGYYKGKMLIGEFKGESVIEAKPKVRQQLIDAGDAFDYAEPDGFVLSRSGDVCVAAHLDQWYLNYGKSDLGGDGAWQQQVLDHVNTDLNTFSSEAKNAFEQTLDWLAQWACARTYGLGSRLPWDPTFLVESLSDSTIYMSYYTIAHLLHKDIFGKELGPANIPPEKMTDQIWDYVFTRRDDVDTDIPKETLQIMRREFEYWYPLDVRISGKDLIQNHLTFFLYIHLALFPKEYWPRGVRVNGHLTLNGAKMSKSTGNFLTLKDATDKFGADATRITLASAGDGMDDANFDEKVANSTILRLYELREWCKGMIQNIVPVADATEFEEARDARQVQNFDLIQRTGEKHFFDELFEDELNGLVRETFESYETAMYREALKSGFYNFTGARDAYREATKAAGMGMHRDQIRRYVELQALMLTPIAPHWAEYIWHVVLEKPDSIQHALFPTVPEQDPSLTAAREYARATASNITSAEGAQQKKLAKGKTTSYDPKKDKKITIYYAKKYPAWQDKCIELVRKAFSSMTVDIKQVNQGLEKSETKRAMPFVNGLKKRLEAGEKEVAVFERKLLFDEEYVLKEMAAGIKQTVPKCQLVEVISVEEGGKEGTIVAGTEGANIGESRSSLPQYAESAEPGSPTFHFENV